MHAAKAHLSCGPPFTDRKEQEEEDAERMKDGMGKTASSTSKYRIARTEQATLSRFSTMDAFLADANTTEGSHGAGILIIHAEFINKPNDIRLGSRDAFLSRVTTGHASGSCGTAPMILWDRSNDPAGTAKKEIPVICGMANPFLGWSSNFLSPRRITKTSRASLAYYFSSTPIPLHNSTHLLLTIATIVEMGLLDSRIACHSKRNFDGCYAEILAVCVAFWIFTYLWVVVVSNYQNLRKTNEESSTQHLHGYEDAKRLTDSSPGSTTDTTESSVP
ncbi:unnamed protein product [Darwinula stevensoni]|uniref:Uncharacterized protein n=1 Tax=Darwinula stevensoni TaxID=69355 RepID=A0A7R8X8A0_9CRUS|nr:unnamed protein product [Darwinula stevensoni]CAG0889890.1 unnamed protein product [Darwinula stevensoni]